MIDFAHGRTLRSACILMLATLLSSGCGEFAYKRGASASDLEHAKNTCREKFPEPAAAAQCLEDSGWVVHDLNRMEPLDADPVIEASVIPSDRRIENASSAAPGMHEAQDKGSAPAPTRQPDVLDTFKISSWWKAGSGASSLETDTHACVAQLGEVHRPVQTQQTQTATRGLLLCMKEKGWSALRAN